MKPATYFTKTKNHTHILIHTQNVSSWRNLFSTEPWYVLSGPNNLQKNFHGRFLASVLAYKCQHVGVILCALLLLLSERAWFMIWVFSSFRAALLLLLGPWMPRGETERRGHYQVSVCLRMWLIHWNKPRLEQCFWVGFGKESPSSSWLDTAVYSSSWGFDGFSSSSWQGCYRSWVMDFKIPTSAMSSSRS